MSNFWDEEDKPVSPAAQPQAVVKATGSFWDQDDIGSVQAPKAAEPKPLYGKKDGTFDQQIEQISKKYNVSPSLLRNYAKDVGSLEAAESSYSTPIAQKIGQVSSAIAGVKESIGMGLPAKAERKIRGLVQGPEYEQALDEVQELVDQRKSAAQKVVEFGAGVAMPMGAAAKGVGLLGKMAAGAKTGAVTGALTGFGASKAGEEASSATKGAAFGGVLGGAVPAIGAAVTKGGEALKEAGEESLTKMFGLGRTMKQRKKLAEAGTTAREATLEMIKKIGGISKQDKEFADVVERISKMKKMYGEGIGTDIKFAQDEKKGLEELFQQYKKGEFAAPRGGLPSTELRKIPDSLFKNTNEDLSERMSKIASSLGDTPDERRLAKQLEKEASRYLKKASKGDMTLKELQTMKVALDKRINYETKANLDANFNKRMRDAVDDTIESQIKNIEDVGNFIYVKKAQLDNLGKDPDLLRQFKEKPWQLLDDFKDFKKEYGYYSKILKAANDAEAARGGRKFETPDSWSVVSGLAATILTGDPVTGVIVGLGKHAAQSVWKKVEAGEISPATAKKIIDWGTKTAKAGEPIEKALQRLSRETTKETLD